MIFRRWTGRKIPQKVAEPLRVISCGAAGNAGVAEGRMLPFVIVDTKSRLDIEEHIKLHEHSGLGDVQSTWMAVKDVGEVCLFLEFDGPTKNSAIVLFDGVGQYLIVDQIIRMNGLYIQIGGGGSGKNFGDSPAIIVEVGADWPMVSWEKVLRKHLEKKYRRDGFNRKTASQLTMDHIAKWRETSGKRLN